MKHFMKILAATIGGLLVPTGDTQAQGGPGRGGPPFGRNPQLTVSFVAERYQQLALYDVDRDGQLSDMELDTIIQARDNGSLPAPPNVQREGIKPDAKRLGARIRAMFANIASFDQNRDGVLDATEQQALQAAVKDRRNAGSQ